MCVCVWGYNNELDKEEDSVCVLVTVGVQSSGGRGNRRDEMLLISKACGSTLFSSFLQLNSRLCGDLTYCRSSVVFA